MLVFCVSFSLTSKVCLLSIFHSVPITKLGEKHKSANSCALYGGLSGYIPRKNSILSYEDKKRKACTAILIAVEPLVTVKT